MQLPSYQMCLKQLMCKTLLLLLPAALVAVVAVSGRIVHMQSPVAVVALAVALLAAVAYVCVEDYVSAAHHTFPAAYSVAGQVHDSDWWLCPVFAEVAAVQLLHKKSFSGWQMPLL